MNHTAVNCEELLLALAECYEHDPSQFVALARQTVDSCFVREIVAGLRNEGYVEERLRGVIRLTARGRLLSNEVFERFIVTASAV